MRYLLFVTVALAFIAFGGRAEAFVQSAPGISAASGDLTTVDLVAKKRKKARAARAGAPGAFSFCAACPIPIPVTRTICTAAAPRAWDAYWQCRHRNPGCYMQAANTCVPPAKPKRK